MSSEACSGPTPVPASSGKTSWSCSRVSFFPPWHAAGTTRPRLLWFPLEGDKPVPKSTDVIKDLVINAGLQEIRAALLEEGLPAEIFVERALRPPLLGNIYKGRVSNVLPGMQSAFVDIGQDRDAFLFVADLFPGTRSGGGPSPSHGRVPSVECLVKPGQEALVQVIKEPLGGKGPRVTTQISLPGRSLVFVPGRAGRAVSRRIEPDGERLRLQQLADAIPGDGGFIVRTAAYGSPPGLLGEEARWLRRRWEEIRSASAGAAAPDCLHCEESLAVRVLRDLLTEEVRRVVVDDESTLEKCRVFLRSYAPHLVTRLQRYEGGGPVFEVMGIEKEIQRALRRRVWLPSGGYLVIHPTEALVAIDVNTGKYVGRNARFEETALATNVEAAREIVRQIRLRDLGGILVIDFIDLEHEENRQELARALEQELKSDRVRSRVLPISEFGLVQITRHRARPGLESLLCGPCPVCQGSGRLRTPQTLRFQIQRELKQTAGLAPEGPWLVRAHPAVVAEIQGNWSSFLEDTGFVSAEGIQIESVRDFHPEEYEIRTS